MNENTNTIYYRLIALWVLCEALLGGIIHGLKLPISGLLVGSAAVICIALIGYYVPTKAAIIKATIVVAVFKMMLSPHSPPPAYIAVFFQGVLGQLLFSNKKMYRLSCFVLAILALVESALQRILVLTIVAGTNFWQAIDEYVSKLAGEKTITSYSFYIAAGYVMLHIIAGVLIGWLASVLPPKINNWKNNVAILNTNTPTITTITSNKRKKIKLGLLLLWFMLIAVYIQSAFAIGKPILPPNIVVQIFVRSILIVLGWYLLVAPVLTKLLQNWLQKKQAEQQTTIQQVNKILPFVKYLVQQSWAIAATAKGYKRFVLFCKTLTVNIIYAV
jgi:hypothetical protein